MFLGGQDKGLCFFLNVGVKLLIIQTPEQLTSDPFFWVIAVVFFPYNLKVLMGCDDFFQS